MGLVATEAAPAALRIAPVVRAALRSHARHEAPNEACGLLLWFASPGDGYQVARGYIPARNASDRPHSEFLVDMSTAAWDPLLDQEAQGTLLLGLWHSHPRGQALPSEADLAGYDLGWAGRPYVVYSLRDDAWWVGQLLPQ